MFRFNPGIQSYQEVNFNLYRLQSNLTGIVTRQLNLLNTLYSV